MENNLKIYTIEDFLKLEPIIYEYCVNLTQVKTSTSWYRDLASAKDLYQEVYLYVHSYYFNKPKEACVEGKFIQIMKNCTFYAYHRRLTRPNAQVYLKLNRIDDSPFDLVKLECCKYQTDSHFKDPRLNPDILYYLKDLTKDHKEAVYMYLDGYTRNEIAKHFNKTYMYIDNIFRKLIKITKKSDIAKPIIENKQFKSKREVVNHEEFLRKKIKNYDIIFKTKRFIEIYSLYLQGISQPDISKLTGKSRPQIGQEIYRINKKVIKNE